MPNITYVPVLWNTKPDFYPIGNTPAVNLLSHYAATSSKDDTAKVLMLGCGDLRSVLYTLWSEGKPGVQKTNFTCCDLEPAILARNLLLSSLIIDNAELYKLSNTKDKRLVSIWNLWHHFYVPHSDQKLVRKQAKKLISYSESPEEWRKCPYACFRFASRESTTEIRKMWHKYAVERRPTENEAYESARRHEIRKTAADSLDPNPELVSNSTYFAGPHGEKATKLMNKALHGFWKHGVAGGNRSDINALKSDHDGVTNPLMMVTSASEEFGVRPTSDPLTAYHLAQVFDGSITNEALVIELMVAHAKRQFQDWCAAFVDYIAQDTVSINIYHGEAVVFCNELVARNPAALGPPITSRLYSTPWSATALVLDERGASELPLQFDAIDTSNLADWTGLLNLLLATRPLLAPKPTSVLYTETFRLSAAEPHRELQESLSMDLDLAGLIFGIAPAGCLLGYTVENNAGEDFVHLDNRNQRYRMRTPWRLLGDINVPFGMQPPKLHFDVKTLVQMLFDVYLKLFPDEDLDKYKARMSNPGRFTLCRNGRSTFANLIYQSMGVITTDWRDVYDRLLEKIANHRTVLHEPAQNSLDLGLHLHFNGAMSIMEQKAFELPAISYLTLIVPQKCLNPIRNVLGGVGLYLAFSKHDRIRRLFSFDAFFGNAEQNADGSWAEITNDSRGWFGTSDLIVTTPIESSMLQDTIMALASCTACATALPMDDGELELGLFVAHSSMLAMSVHQLTEKMDPTLKVFGTTFRDRRHLHVSKFPPGVPKERFDPLIKNLPYSSPAPDSAIVMSAQYQNRKLHLQATYNLVPGSAEALALTNSALVEVVEPAPFSITLKVGDHHTRQIQFPMLINPKNYKARISRKNGWIEVTVPTASAHTDGGYDSNPFPTVVNGNYQTHSWALTRMNLPQLPKVKTTDPKDWLSDTMGQVSSSWEKGLRSVEPPTADSRTTKLYVRRLIHRMMEDVVQPTKHHNFLISDSKMSVMDMLIVGNCVRHTRENGSLVLDGWIIPIAGLKLQVKLLGAVGIESDVNYSAIAAEVRKMLKQLMPSAVECCRKDWSHTATCAYLANGKTPASMADWESPICSCGEGKDTEGFPSSSFVGSFENIATRVALPLLSAVSYIEPMAPIYRYAPIDA